MARKNKKNKEQAQQAPVQNQQMPMGMPGFPYPVAPPSHIVQLPPIVQPIIMVPFSAQQQPMAKVEEEDDFDDFDF